MILQQTNARMITDVTSSTVPPSPCATEDAHQGRASFAVLPTLEIKSLEIERLIMAARLTLPLLVTAFLTIAQAGHAQTSTLEQSLRQSDDVDLHLAEFVLAGTKLIERGTCTTADFHEAGGWAKATGANQSRPVYFTYCGGFTIPNRWYVNIETGRVYQ